jgi:hypothetical protein
MTFEWSYCLQQQTEQFLQERLAGNDAIAFPIPESDPLESSTLAPIDFEPIDWQALTDLDQIPEVVI